MSLAVELKALTKVYAGGITALNSLDLQVNPGEVFGIVGPDGAGKTTLLKTLAAILRPTAGSGQVLGHDLGQAPEQVRQRIGYIAQHFSLYGDLTVEENVDFTAALYPLRSDQAKLKAELLDRIGLAPFKDRLASNLSGGMKQKLALLCCLIHEPDLLLLDEPTVGVDPVSRREFWRILFSFEEVTVVAATPYMDEAEQFDRLALLDGGSLLQVGSAREIRDSLPGRVLEVACDDPFVSVGLLRGRPGIKDVQLFGDRLHVLVEEGAEPDLGGLLSAAEVKIARVRAIEPSVEDVFLQLSTRAS